MKTLLNPSPGKSSQIRGKKSKIKYKDLALSNESLLDLDNEIS